MLYVQNKLHKLTTIMFLLFIFWVGVIFFQRSKWAVGKIKTQLYKDAWFIIDVIILVFSIICITLFIVRTYMIRSYLGELEKVQNNVFINYFYLFQLDHLLTVFGAFLVCVATIRLWRILRFGAVFRVMEKTMFIASRTLGCYLLVHIVVLMAFALCAFLLFHENAVAFYSLKNTVTTLTIFAMGFTRKEQEILYKMSPAFFAVFLLVTFIIRLGYVIVIILSYKQAMRECSEIPSTYNVKTYVTELLKYLPMYLRIMWRRLRGGSSPDLVQPKNELIYFYGSKVIARTRMGMMRAITLGLLKNGLEKKTKRKLDKDDVNTMLKLTRPLLVKRLTGVTERKEVFFKGHIHGERLKFVDVKRLEQMRSVVENMLKLKK